MTTVKLTVSAPETTSLQVTRQWAMSSTCTFIPAVNLVMSAPSVDGCLRNAIVNREDRAPHLLTPSTGLVTEPRTNPNLQHCDDCGSPIRNTGTWNRPRYVCGNYSCPKCPFQRDRVNTSFSVVEG